MIAQTVTIPPPVEGQIHQITAGLDCRAPVKRM